MNWLLAWKISWLHKGKSMISWWTIVPFIVYTRCTSLTCFPIMLLLACFLFLFWTCLAYFPWPLDCNVLFLLSTLLSRYTTHLSTSHQRMLLWSCLYRIALLELSISNSFFVHLYSTYNYITHSILLVWFFTKIKSSNSGWDFVCFLFLLSFFSTMEI